MNDLTAEDKKWIDANVKTEPVVYQGNASKKLTTAGIKAWQTDYIDNTVDYKKFLHEYDLNGFCIDIDEIKWKYVNGKLQPAAIIELTACDWETVATAQYLESIEDRLFNRDNQGLIMETLGKILNVPVYWSLFPPLLSWFYVFSIRKREWRLFQPDEYITFLKNL